MAQSERPAEVHSTGPLSATTGAAAEESPGSPVALPLAVIPVEADDRGVDADRRSAVLTGVFLLLGTVVGVIGSRVVLEPLNSAPDYLTAYGESETRVAVASLVELFMGVALVGGLRAPAGTAGGGLAVWLMAKELNVSALASVAPAGGPGGSS
jgi:hypothetical protein